MCLDQRTAGTAVTLALGQALGLGAGFVQVFDEAFSPFAGELDLLKSGGKASAQETLARLAECVAGNTGHVFLRHETRGKLA